MDAPSKIINNKSPSLKSNTSFTLIELLVVIGILAILTAAVIIILNPAEYLKQTRDVTRMNDLTSINQALSVLESQGITNFGLANTVYVSIPDTTSTCANLGLPTLPSNYSYHCVSTSTLQSSNGTGWIPVDFTQSATLSFSSLPIDPINTTSTGDYYTYTAGGSWDLTTSFESSKYKLGGSSDKASTDGGQYPDLYEVGSNKTLLPIDYGDTSLIWYFPLTEGSGTTVYNRGFIGGTGLFTNSDGVMPMPQWATGYKGGSGVQFSCNHTGTLGNGIVSSAVNSFFSSPINATIIAWINPNYSTSTGDNIANIYTSSGGCQPKTAYAVNGFRGIITDNAGTIYYSYGFSSIPSPSAWHFVASVFHQNTNTVDYYLDGQIITTTFNPNASALLFSSNPSILEIGGDPCGWGLGFNGVMNDVYVYNRALSASEIYALYNATK